MNIEKKKTCPYKNLAKFDFFVLFLVSLTTIINPIGSTDVSFSFDKTLSTRVKRYARWCAKIAVSANSGQQWFSILF